MNKMTYRGFKLERVGISWYWVDGYSRRYIGQTQAEAKDWVKWTVCQAIVHALGQAHWMAQ